MTEKHMEKAYRKQCLKVAKQISGITVLDDEERQPCEIWTRVMGYHRPVSQFNKGKKAEFYSRKYFSEEKTLPEPDIDYEQPTGIRLPYKD